MSILGLLDFQEKIVSVITDYQTYLEDDLNDCNEEGEVEYAEQRFRQLEELDQLKALVSKEVYSLSPFEP